MVLSVKTSAKNELVDVTSRVAQAVSDSQTADGVCLVYVPHTTAGVTINEAADPSVATDLVKVLNHMVPDDLGYRHAEGNSPAHAKATLTGSSVLIEIRDGRLVLGTWQGVFFCEFDGPRTRKLHVTVMGR